jgi:hypothetical protein
MGLSFLGVVGVLSDGRLGGIFSRCREDGRGETSEEVSSAILDGYPYPGLTHQSISAT